MLSQEMYAFIKDKCGGKNSKIKGTDLSTLNNMKLGKSNLTFKTFSKIAKENGFESEIRITKNGETLTLKLA